MSTTYAVGGTTATGRLNWNPNTTLQWPASLDNDNTSGIAWHHHVSVPYNDTVTVPEASFKVYGHQQSDEEPQDTYEEINKSMKKLGLAFSQRFAENLDGLIMDRSEEDQMPKSSERTVFNVFVIDPEGDGKVVATLKNVIAQGSEAAKLKAIYELSSQADKLEKALEDYDILVEDVADFGSIRAKKE